MKVARKYILVINHFTDSATYSTHELNTKHWLIPLCKIFYCNLKDLKYNIRLLKRKGFTVLPR